MKAILVADVPDEFIEGKVTHIDIVHPEDENRVYRIEGWSLPQFIPLFSKVKSKKENAKTPVMLDKYWRGCPNCKTKLISHDKPKYCQTCGQALLWLPCEPENI